MVGKHLKQIYMKNKQFTFMYIKPDAFEYSEEILALIRKEGFEIIYISKEPIILTREQAEAFYGQHKGRPFFEDLMKHTVSGPIIAAVLEKENAINDFRILIGTTNPALAEKGTIRNLYGNADLYTKGIPANAIHGSDSTEGVKTEIKLLFPEFEDM